MIQPRSYRFFAAVALFLLLPTAGWAQVIAGSPEDKAYQAISRETDARKRIDLLNAFVKNFPNSPDMAQIYEFYANSYRELSDANKEIEYAEKSLSLRKNPELMVMLGRVLAIKGENLPQALQSIKDGIALADKIKDNPPPGISQAEWRRAQESVKATGKQLLDYALDRYKQIFYAQLPAETDPNKIVSMLNEFTGIVDDPESKPLVYDQYIRAYLRLQNRGKVLEYAGRALALNPYNVDILMLTTSAFLEQPIDMDNAMMQAQKAVSIADALDTAVKPPALAVEQWAKAKTHWKALAYSTRGLVELQKETTLEAALADLEKARSFSPEDGIVQYRLGIAYWKSRKIEEAIQALAKSAVVASIVQNQASQLLETYYKAAHKGSTDGLKELLDKSRGTIEKPNGV